MAGDRYRGVVFVPADLAEDVELTVDQKKEILFLHGRLGSLNYWELLGVEWNAPVEACQEAYRQKALLLHPDRHRGRRLGSYEPRLKAVFPRLNEAREILADPARRVAYARSTASPEDRARMQVRALEDERRSAERRARLARANPLVARAEKAQDLLSRGKLALEEGRWQQAQNDLQTAFALDPKNLEARRLAEEARRRLGGSRAAEAYERGLALELAGNHAGAFLQLRKAAEEEPTEPRWATAAARVARAAGDLATARELAEQAVRVGPRSGPAHEELAQVLAALGEAKEARRHAERALELEPRLEGAKALLKKKWGIFG